MSSWNLIKSLRFTQLLSLGKWFFKHPIYMTCTVFATFKTYRISQRKFPNIHGKHNKANAFRHALWNILIAEKCLKFSKSITSVISWAKEITDWHEEFSPNEILAKTMDLHNNKYGRDFFTFYKNLDSEKRILKLVDNLQLAKKIKTPNEVKGVLEMVYIEE